MHMPSEAAVALAHKKTAFLVRTGGKGRQFNIAQATTQQQSYSHIQDNQVVNNGWPLLANHMDIHL